MEDVENKMFIGPSGQIINRLFHVAGIDRKSVYMTNLVKCMLPKNRRPKMDEIEACSQFLNEEIEILDPEIIVPLGFYATRYILTKYHADSPSAPVEFSQFYGKLLFSEKQKIFPLPHPSSLLYNPSFEPQTRMEYKKLKILSHDCKWISLCPLRKFYDQGRLEEKWIEVYCRGLWSACLRYQLLENGKYLPDWMLPDGRLDENLKSIE
jgi:DNA polymerase